MAFLANINDRKEEMVATYSTFESSQELMSTANPTSFVGCLLYLQNITLLQGEL